MKKKVYVTGLGVVSPYGVGVDIFWQSLKDGLSAFRPVTLFDATPFRNSMVGEVVDFSVLEPYSRAVSFLLQATSEAVLNAELDPSVSNIAFSLGTNFGGINSYLSQIEELSNNPENVNLNNASFFEAENALRDKFAFAGDCHLLSLSCASGTAAIGLGFDRIRRGEEDVVICGGFDELSIYSYAGLSALRAITKDTILPFHKNRSGTLFAEGSAVIVLESEQSVEQRGITPIAMVSGMGINNDAFHMTAPEKDGRGIRKVMEMAIADAGLESVDIDHINCHATATRYNDAIETMAIKKVFGSHADKMILTANKSCFGHAMGAAGALEAVSTILSVREDVVPPTLNLDEPDDGFELDYCPLESRHVNIGHAMSNSYGLGGANASVVISKIK